MKEKLNEISLLKTSMMILVVLYHSCLFYTGTWFTYVTPAYSAKFLTYFTYILNTFHIQAFTMASGFLFYYLKAKGKYNDCMNDIKRRAKRLLVPLVFTLILWVIPIYIKFYGINQKILINKFLLLVSPSQLWFLPMLFLIFCFFEIFSDKIKINVRGLTYCYIITTILGYGLQLLDVNYFQINTAIRYILYFYLGGLLYYNRDKINKKEILYLAIGTIIILIFLLITKDTGIKLLKYINILITPVLSLCEVSLIYFLYDWLVNNKKINLNNRLYKILEDNSFGIYLFHQQVVYICILLLNGLVHPIIQCILAFIISLSISLIMSIVFKKFKITRFMFGV